MVQIGFGTMSASENAANENFGDEQKKTNNAGKSPL